MSRIKYAVEIRTMLNICVLSRKTMTVIHLSPNCTFFNNYLYRKNPMNLKVIFFSFTRIIKLQQIKTAPIYKVRHYYTFY